MDAREANVLVHSKMAASYNEREPHFRPENRAKVRRVLESLRREFGGRLLDVGCGTGFIIDLAEDLFDDICGIDITPAMLARVRAGRANIRTVEADASALPFEDERFDVVSGYSFFHHLEHLAPAVQEVHRVLRPGGCFYADLEPNRHFWDNVTSVKPATDEATPRLTLDEISSVCHTDEKVAREYGIAPEVFNPAASIPSSSQSCSVRRDSIESRCRTNGLRDKARSCTAYRRRPPRPLTITCATRCRCLAACTSTSSFSQSDREAARLRIADVWPGGPSPDRRGRTSLRWLR
jgi:ubiquinone/menaquinone biosynthesis C-methylase UbiE